jgi:arylsulfatase A
MMLTHDPYQATPDSTDYGGKKKELKKSGKLIDKRPDGTNQHFADMVTYMDKLIGQLVSQLDETGQRDNTLILFTGDNGTGAGTISYMGDRKVVGGKGKTIETGMHVPLIANWPSVVSSGQVSQDLVDSTDFLPTLCEATGTAIPANLELDGRSFYPQLRGEPGKPRDWIYCWYGKGAKSEFARNHRYKLYRGGDFFDVSNGDADDRPLDVNLLSDEAVAARRLLQSALDQFTDARPAQFAAPAKATKGDKAKPKKSQSKS